MANLSYSPLYRAIRLWREHRPIPMDLYAELVERGYDVPTLERHYRA